MLTPETASSTGQRRKPAGPHRRLQVARSDGAVSSIAESDTELVAGCLGGDERAWERLIQRYKRLIYSVPLKYGADADAAADIFQAVCVDLVAELPRLRKPEALKGWLVRVAQNKALKWKTRARRRAGWVQADDDVEGVADEAPDAAQTLDTIQKEQALRTAVESLPDRCRELVRLLFFTSPPLPYTAVARQLGLATGSIGFIRGRCLKKLEAALKTAGV